MAALGESLRCTTLRAPGATGGGASVFVPRDEPGSGVPLFLAPAFGLDGRSFDRLSPLAGARPVAFWNFPNVLPERGRIEGLGRLYLEHAGHAGMPERFVFGGSSLGGMIALAAALEAPERCAGLVLIGACASWREMGARLKLARMLLPLLPARGFHLRFASILFGAAGRSDELDALRLQAEHRTKAHVLAVTRLLFEGGAFDLGHRFHEITAPTLVLHSPRDGVIPFDAAQSFTRIRGARIAPIERGGHLPQVSRPDECLAELTPFLASIDARERA